MLKPKQSTSFTLTTDALDLIEGLHVAMGISKTAVIETSIRDLAERKGVKLASLKEKGKK